MSGNHTWALSSAWRDHKGTVLKVDGQEQRSSHLSVRGGESNVFSIHTEEEFDKFNKP